MSNAIENQDLKRTNPHSGEKMLPGRL